MTEIVLKPELIKGLQKVLVEYEPANEDPILAAQYHRTPTHASLT